jgi:hypothetical protein
MAGRMSLRTDFSPRGVWSGLLLLYSWLFGVSMFEKMMI